MIDPKKILRFVTDNFDEVKALYNLQKEKGTLQYEHINTIFDTEYKFNTVIEYAIIEEKIDETFVLRELYYNLMEGLLDDYSLDMPEQIEKYHTSLSKLSLKLKSISSKNETLSIIQGLLNEINKFDFQLKRNVKKLIEETKYIKANNDKLEYSQKVQKASELSTKYLEPLNIIMQNHSDSIVHLIDNVQQHANTKRFEHDDIHIRNQYEMLSNTFSRVKREIQNHNRLLINEVIPLLERIKSESGVLTGFINFLGDANAFEVPEMMQKNIPTVYSINSKWDARDIWDSVDETQEDVIIENATEVENKWLYDTKKYTKQLHASLPLDDFYNWIEQTLNSEDEIIDSKKFLALSKLIFNKEIDVTYTSNKTTIVLEDKIITAPVAQVKRKKV